MNASDHELEAIFRRAVEQRGDQAAPPRPYEMLLYVTPPESERQQTMRNKPFFLLAAVGVVLAVVAVGAVLAVATNDSRTETGPTDTSTPTSTPTSAPTSAPPLTPTSTPPASDDVQSDDSTTATPEEAALAETERLRAAVGATQVVAHDGESSFVTDADGGRVLPVPGWSIVDGYAYDEAAGGFIDLTGELACASELLGDFIVHAGSRMDGDQLILIFEDRRALAFDDFPIDAGIPRVEYNCATDESLEVASTTSVSREDSEEETIVTRQVGDQRIIERRGIGDTPVEVSLEGGPMLISRDELAYDYEISDDGTVLYYTSYLGSGAAEPPARLTAVDLTGQILWTVDQPTFVADEYGDFLIVTVVEPILGSDGRFPPEGVAVVNRSTGEVVDTVPFEYWIVSVE